MDTSVRQDSFLTLRYRITTSDGTEIVSTFGSTPSTLQMGSGELIPTLEQCLVGMKEGEQRSYELSPEQAFGPHSAGMVRRVPRKDLPGFVDPAINTLAQFKTPTGESYAGLIRELDDEAALVDFNHPLAGKRIRFDVEIIGIM